MPRIGNFSEQAARAARGLGDKLCGQLKAASRGCNTTQIDARDDPTCIILPCNHADRSGQVCGLLTALLLPTNPGRRAPVRRGSHRSPRLPYNLYPAPICPNLTQQRPLSLHDAKRLEAQRASRQECGSPALPTHFVCCPRRFLIPSSLLTCAVSCHPMGR